MQGVPESLATLAIVVFAPWFSTTRTTLSRISWGSCFGPLSYVNFVYEREKVGETVRHAVQFLETNL